MTAVKPLACPSWASPWPGSEAPSPKFFPSGNGFAPARLDGLLSTSARISSEQGVMVRRRSCYNKIISFVAATALDFVWRHS